MSRPPANEASSAARGRLGRRAALLGALGVAGLAVAGCGIHLQDDAPDVPLLPHRTPIGAEAQLLSLLRNSRELAVACARWTSGTPATVHLAPTLATIHQHQVRVLAALLAAAHVPADLVTAATPRATSTTTSIATGGATAASTTAGAAPTPTPTPVSTSDVAALELGPLATAAELAQAPAALRPAVAAMLAQRYAAATVTGGTTPVLAGAASAAPIVTPSSGPRTTVTTSPTPTSSGGSTSAGGPAGTWPETDLVGVLSATRSAVYGFEVVAAQGDKAGRALGLRTLATLADLQQEQLAGLASSPPPPDIGYELPFPVTTPALAHKLAGVLATGLRAAYGSHLTATAQGRGPFLDLVRWLGEVEVIGHDWGGLLVAFPGMTTP